MPPAVTTGTSTAASTAASSGRKRDRAANVAARLDALRDDEVAAGRGRAARLLGRPDLPPVERVALVDARHGPGVGIGIEQLHEPRPRGRELELLLVTLAERRDGVHADGPSAARSIASSRSANV